MAAVEPTREEQLEEEVVRLKDQLHNRIRQVTQLRDELATARQNYQATGEECVEWMRKHSTLCSRVDTLEYDLRQMKAKYEPTAELCEDGNEE